MGNSIYLADDFTDATKKIALKVIAVLKEENVTVADVRDVLRYIDATIDRNSVIM